MSAERRSNRRQFITRFVPGVAVAASPFIMTGCLDMASDKKDGATSTPNPTEHPTASPTPEYTQSIQARNISFTFDRQGQPVGYIQTLDDGTSQTIKFDKKILQAQKDLAMSTNTPQIVTRLSFNELESKYTPSIEHPRLTSLPPDVLDVQDVEQRGVHIVQPESTTLYIRKAAFEIGGPFEAFNATKRKLNIVLVDGPIVHTKFMSDPKYTPYLAAVQQSEKSPKNQVSFLDLPTMRAALTSGYEDKINQLTTLLENPALSPEERKTAQTEYMKNMLSLLDMQQATDVSITSRYAVTRTIPSAAGLYDEPFIFNSATVYVATGTAPQTESVALYYKADGTVSVYHAYHQFGHDYRPKPEENTPDPNDFKLDLTASAANPDSYPYKGQTTGLTLDHELTHDRLIEQARRHGMKPNYSEYDTDTGAMSLIKQGWEKWVSSGFTDNTGYYFVWSVDKSLGRGFIVTAELDAFLQHLLGL